MNLKSHPLLVFSCGYLIIMIIIAIFFPMLSHQDPYAFDPNFSGIPLSPSFQHPFGTDDLGRDLLIRMVYGARISLSIGFIAVGIATVLGVLVGLIAGFFGKWVDAILMRAVDCLLALPIIFIILTLQILLKPSIFTVMAVIGCTSWMGTARLVRAEVLSLKERPFILAAKARSISNFRLLFKHILPLSLNPVIVSATMGIGSAILTESAISFLGLGVQPPFASWGNMLQNSLAFMNDAPWMAFIPGGFITVTVLAFNLLGDMLRHLIQPEGNGCP